ncbi:hypothetical protein ACFWBC_37390 [Streptomyces sp. NPDC059985]|uniref:hypothetical protein n=1 Tax=Streptomyces sp. NPDC059985 TaxID=3347025 RepID=UPI0036B8A9E7
MNRRISVSLDDDRGPVCLEFGRIEGLGWRELAGANQLAEGQTGRPGLEEDHADAGLLAASA